MIRRAKGLELMFFLIADLNAFGSKVFFNLENYEF
jgi:hypothetical protein